MTRPQPLLLLRPLDDHEAAMVSDALDPDDTSTYWQVLTVVGLVSCMGWILTIQWWLR